MKKILLLVIAAFLAGSSAQAADVKIAYVELQKIVTMSDQGKEAMSTLDSIEKAKNALIKEKIDEIKKLEEEFTKQGAILNAEAKQKKQMEHEKLMMEYQQMRKERDDELKKNEGVFVQKIVLEVKKLLEKIAKEEGYTAILNDAVVVYMPEELNLTDKVMKQFNELTKKTGKE